MRNWGKLVIAALALLASPVLAQRPPSNEELADKGYVVDGGHQASWYYAQHKKLDAAIAALKPQRPGIVDAYVIAVGLDADAVFGREAAEASRVLSHRFDGDGRTLLLAAGGGAADPKVAYGSPQNLAVALGAVAAVMDVKEDVLIFYSTSHGAPKIGLAYQDGESGNGLISPKHLKEMLDGFGISRRMVILSACYAGQFVPALDNGSSVIITAASDSTTSFGCAASNDWTFFGDALINNAMREPIPLVDTVGKAFGLVSQWEFMKGLPASVPQFRIGNKVGEWLTPLEARMPKDTSAKVGRPSTAG